MPANFQSSGKTQSGNIHVVGGDTFDDFLANLIALYGSEDAANDVLEEMRNTLAPVSGGVLANATANVQAQMPAQVQQPRAQAATPPPPGQEAPLCGHGIPRTWKAGTSKAGKPYKMWACAAQVPRDAQCGPEWVR